jgi:hypothetical protein
MADKNVREATLANAANEASYDLGQALAQPAGPNRIENISKAQDALIQAEAAYSDCLSGRGYTVPIKR